MNSDPDTRHKLIEILQKFDTVMVVNEGRDGTLHGRPMAVADITPSGELWFVTSRDSEKAREVAEEARTVVTGQQHGAYVSITGRMDVVNDRERVHALWKDAWKVWFPNGVSDPEIVLLRLDPDAGEYWSTGGTAGIRYLFEAAKALVNGDRPATTEPEQHAKVAM